MMKDASNSLVFYDMLVFDGTAYIETNLSIPADGSIRFSCGGETAKTGQRLYNVQENGYRISAYLGSDTNNTKRVFGVFYDSSSYLATRDLNWTTDEYSFYQTPGAFGLGNSKTTYTKGSTHPTTGIFIGGWGSGNPFTGYMYKFYIYGGDAKNCQSYSELGAYTPVYTLRPCTYYGEAGYWCVETSTFYGNTAGSGTLSVRNSN